MAFWILVGWTTAGMVLAWMVSRWNQFLRGDFDVQDLPRVEDIANLVSDGQYVENARVSVVAFDDLADRDVLIVVGDRWTLLEGEAFKRLAERLLPQL